MSTPILRNALPAILAGACALPLAHADIYTWTDASGKVNVSNLTPPDGVRVTGVLREDKAMIAARDAARETALDALREAEVRLLAERVRQLQSEVEVARRPAPPQIEYRPIPTPVYVPYPVEVAAPPQYVVPTTPTMYAGCSFGWPDCGAGWYPGIYPVNVVVTRPPHFRGDHPGNRRDPPGRESPGPGHIAPWLPISTPGGGRGH
jgi:Domain of unknown function (DUF4124)